MPIYNSDENDVLSSLEETYRAMIGEEYKKLPRDKMKSQAERHTEKEKTTDKGKAKRKQLTRQSKQIKDTIRDHNPRETTKISKENKKGPGEGNRRRVAPAVLDDKKGTKSRPGWKGDRKELEKVRTGRPNRLDRPWDPAEKRRLERDYDSKIPIQYVRKYPGADNSEGPQGGRMPGEGPRLRKGAAKDPSQKAPDKITVDKPKNKNSTADRVKKISKDRDHLEKSLKGTNDREQLKKSLDSKIKRPRSRMPKHNTKGTIKSKK